MTETQFQNKVISLAKQLGWLCYHTYDSRRSQAGMPDLLLIRDRILYRELKTDTGRLTLAQKVFGKRIVEAGGDYAVWRPSEMGVILEQLKKR